MKNIDDEYNDEVGMVTSNLLTTIRSSKKLMNLLKSNENLPEWVQEKISKATSMIVAATNYMESQHEKNEIYFNDSDNESLQLLQLRESLRAQFHKYQNKKTFD